MIESIRMTGVIPTDAALTELQKVIKESNLENVHVRVAVAGGGCSGFQYRMAFEEADQIDPDLDTVESHGDVRFVIDKKSLLYLDGTTLDWIDDLNNRGFKFDNPQSRHSCGCGRSFGV